MTHFSGILLDPPSAASPVADPEVDSAAGEYDLDMLTVPVGETPTSRRIVDSGTYTCSTQSCCTTNSCH